MKKIKEFIIEWELLTTPLGIIVSILSFILIPIIFFTAGAAETVKPSLECFYYAAFAIPIWFGFWVPVWWWTKRNLPELAAKLKEPDNLTYKEALIFLLAIFFSLVAVAWLVFP